MNSDDLNVGQLVDNEFVGKFDGFFARFTLTNKIRFRDDRSMSTTWPRKSDKNNPIDDWKSGKQSQPAEQCHINKRCVPKSKSENNNEIQNKIPFKVNNTTVQRVQQRLQLQLVGRRLLPLHPMAIRCVVRMQLPNFIDNERNSSWKKLRRQSNKHANTLPNRCRISGPYTRKHWPLQRRHTKRVSVPKRPKFYDAGWLWRKNRNRR